MTEILFTREIRFRFKTFSNKDFMQIGGRLKDESQQKYSALNLVKNSLVE